MKDSLLVYTAARTIADIALELWESELKPLEDRRGEPVNPYYNQTVDGLFIQAYYGKPDAIWTPWGEWGCWGCGVGRADLTEEFIRRVGETVETIPAESTPQEGIIYPVFAVISVGDIVLPEPELQDKASFIEYGEAKRLWVEVDRQFREAQVEA